MSTVFWLVDFLTSAVSIAVVLGPAMGPMLLACYLLREDSDLPEAPWGTPPWPDEAPRPGVLEWAAAAAVPAVLLSPLFLGNTQWQWIQAWFWCLVCAGVCKRLDLRRNAGLKGLPAVRLPAPAVRFAKFAAKKALTAARAKRNPG